MANKHLFKSIVGKLAPRTDTLNEELAPAYAFEPRHALAQYAATGCLNATFYASADEQLDRVLKLCREIEPEFIARTAIYARQRGRMKDLPALLCAVLSVKSPGLLAEVFDRVIDSPRMLRNFVQIMRSGAVGRKSLGSLPKRLILQWLEARSDEQLFKASVGNDPSLADIVKMVHPRPTTKSREALLGYLIGRQHDVASLPAIVQTFERFKTDLSGEVPDVPFQMLTALPLDPPHWAEIARNAPFQMTRMNLNTFARHGVFEQPGMTKLIAERLADKHMVERSGVLPYQWMVAYLSASRDLPDPVREALQDAMEIAIRNVPRVNGQVYIFPDVSGSMHSPVTGYRKGSSTAVRCIDVAGLVAAAIVRRNPTAKVLPFAEDVVSVNINPRDSVMTNAQKLASLPAGGTNCSAPLATLNRTKAMGDLLVYVSDNESWIDAPHYGRFGGSATQTMTQWHAFKQRNPAAKLVCIDLQPYGHTQAKEQQDITNVGGFSDAVFQLLADISEGRAESGYWVRQIEAVRI